MKQLKNETKDVLVVLVVIVLVGSSCRSTLYLVDVETRWLTPKGKKRDGGGERVKA